MEYKRKIPRNFDKSKFFQRCYKKEPVAHFYTFLNMLEKDKEHNKHFNVQLFTLSRKKSKSIYYDNVRIGLVAFHTYVQDLEEEVVRLRKIIRANNINYKHVSCPEKAPKTTYIRSIDKQTHLPAPKQDHWTGFFKRLFTKA